MVFMCNIHQTHADKAKDCFLVSHVTKILSNTPVLQPKLEIVSVESLDNLCTTFLEPTTTLLTRKLENGVIVLLRQLERALLTL